MSEKPRFQIGDELFVHNPARFVDGATCIVGPVQAVSQMGDGGWAYAMAASVGRAGHLEQPPEGQAMRFAECDLGVRMGTPISQISGRPGHAGYDEFRRIAASWGYD